MSPFDKFRRALPCRGKRNDAIVIAVNEALASGIGYSENEHPILRHLDVFTD
jgi:hypothetical protein